MENVFKMISMAVGVFILSMILVVAWSPDARKSLFDHSAKSFLSEEDYEAVKDPQAANKKAYEKLGRDAWENSKRNQPTWNPNQPAWTPNWKK